MQFTSTEFIFYFLPLFLTAYWFTPKNGRVWVLTAGSLLFYALASGWDTAALALLLIMTAYAYISGRAMERLRSRVLRAALVLVPAGVLAVCKLAWGGEYLKVGMSFYIFQIIAYLVDVKRGTVRAERSAPVLASHIVMFPKLTSGPIAESGELERHARSPRLSAFTLNMGIREYVLGLALKVLIADRVGGIWARAQVVGFSGVSVPFAWLALVSFSMRMYFDFYGYSLMAVGLGHMIGYHLPMNFLEPYSAKTVSEFYRRWHATLGRWFREYVYIPLGGNRRGRGRTILNLAAVWLLTGLWHGVTGGYVLWGAVLFALIAIERLWLRERLERTRVLCHVYLVAVILLSWVPFAAGTLSATGEIYGRLFGITPGAAGTDDFFRWLADYAWLLAAGAVLATPLPKRLWLRLRDAARVHTGVQWAVDGAIFALFWVCAVFAAISASDPFLYFNF